MKTILLSCLVLLIVGIGQAQPADFNSAQIVSEPNPEIQDTGPFGTVICYRPLEKNASATLDNVILLGGATEKNRASVGIGTTNPSSLASIDLGDSDKGFLPNRMRQKQIEVFEMSLGVSEEGMTVYNVDKGRLQNWDGTQWITLGTEPLKLKKDQLQLGDLSSIDLSEYKDNTDEQDLKSATLNGNELTIEIENGESVTVDLSPLLESYEARLRRLEELLEANGQISANGSDENLASASSSGARLYQNSPNPVTGFTQVKYFIPENVRDAQLVLQNANGQAISTKKLFYTGSRGIEDINTSQMVAGTYYYSLFVDGKKVDTKKMIVR